MGQFLVAALYGAPRTDWLCRRGVGPGGDVFSTRVTSERTRAPVACVGPAACGHVVARAQRSNRPPGPWPRDCQP